MGIWIEFKGARQLFAALALTLSLVCGLPAASAQDTHSSIEDRQRFVSITRDIEKAPLDSSLKAHRAWAVRWLTDAPDITVTVCSDSLAGVVLSEYPYSTEILVQYMFSMAAGIIEDPEMRNDKILEQLTGVEGALSAYRSILRHKPEARSPTLDDLIETQIRGELIEFVGKAYASCKAKS